VQAVFSALLQSQDVYKDRYSGYYCVPDETFWTKTDLQQELEKRAKEKSPTDLDKPRCPNCGKPLIWVEEDGYFFSLSKYQEKLLQHYKAHPEFLQPSHRAPEILRFVESGLKDLSISRSTAKVPWGIPVPNDPDHTIYVWFDALLNYITAIGYAPPGWKPPAGLMEPDGRPPFEDLWPADVQLVGKEIYRFHAVIWPAMLLALGLPLPRTVFAHGWWTVEGEKMSKSKENFIDPYDVTREFGVDALRYFLFREMPFGNDGDFSIESLKKRYNAELANDLGNLVSRVSQMVDKYLQGELPKKPPIERPMMTKSVADESKAICNAMERLAFSEALNRIWLCIGRLNQHVDKEAPWKMEKAQSEKLKFLLFDLVWSLRMIAGWIYPFMPQTAARMQMQLGVRQFPAPLTADEVLSGQVQTKIQKAPPLFPRK
jgi:methionyl-tRNA synthetase